MTEHLDQRGITPPQFIRQQILKMSRVGLASALGLHKSTITKWEERGFVPDRHRQSIDKLAAAKGLRIKKSWHDSVPWDPRAKVPK